MYKKKRSLAAHLSIAASYWGYTPDFLDVPHEYACMLRGMRKYQNHEFIAEPLPLKMVWNIGELKIKAPLSYEYRQEYPTILLIPSLINKAHILDLVPQRSMLRFMAEHKINAYLLDWGQGVQDEGQVDVESLIVQRLVPAFEFLAQYTKAPIHALGYCMGGVLLSAAASFLEKSRGEEALRAYLKSLVFLATPWDFHGGAGNLLKRIEYWTPGVWPVMEAQGVLSSDYIQTLFASLDPQMTAKKFADFGNKDKEEAEEVLFVAVEDWLNDPVALPVKVAQDCIMNWFIKNEPVRKLWSVAGHLVEPEHINLPALVVASDGDHLVDFENAKALHEALPYSTLLNPSCGHIGMIAGRHSIEHIWKPICKFIHKQ